MSGDVEQTCHLVERLGLTLTAEQQQLSSKPKELMRAVMHQWLPAGDAMLQIITLYLPSPLTAQRYRTEILYEGPMDDDVANGKTTDSSLFLLFILHQQGMMSL